MGEKMKDPKLEIPDELDVPTFRAELQGLLKKIEQIEDNRILDDVE